MYGNCVRLTGALFIFRNMMCTRDVHNLVLSLEAESVSLHQTYVSQGWSANGRITLDEITVNLLYSYRVMYMHCWLKVTHTHKCTLFYLLIANFQLVIIVVFFAAAACRKLHRIATHRSLVASNAPIQIRVICLSAAPTEPNIYI